MSSLGPVPGLDLPGLQGHPRFAQARETGVPELMAGGMGEPGRPGLGGTDDLVQAVFGQRLTGSGSLSARQRHARCWQSRAGRGRHVGPDRAEKACRAGGEALVATLALGNKDSAFAGA